MTIRTRHSKPWPEVHSLNYQRNSSRTPESVICREKKNKLGSPLLKTHANEASFASKYKYSVTRVLLLCGLSFPQQALTTDAAAFESSFANQSVAISSPPFQSRSEDEDMHFIGLNFEPYAREKLSE